VASFGAGFLAQGIGYQFRKIIQARRGHRDCENIHHHSERPKEDRAYNRTGPDIQLSRRGQHEGNEYLLRKLSLQQSTIWADDALLSEARVRMRSGNVISAHVSRKRSL
jgi:hypothetical protein